MTHRIAVLVGSLRKGSFTRRVAEATVKLSPGGGDYTWVGIGELPLYNQDLEDSGAPAAWTAFRETIKTFDGVLFATAEYNRSIPAALKNALDVGSRPFGKNVWNGKPAGILSVSPGNLGGFGANHHLRQVLTFLNMPAMAQPEAYVGGAAKLVDDAGAITVEATRDFLKAFITAFEAWVARLAPPKA
jgi:chromate reductase, NAD(P)H dehydrogenase (quinone)